MLLSADILIINYYFVRIRILVLVIDLEPLGLEYLLLVVHNYLYITYYIVIVLLKLGR